MNEINKDWFMDQLRTKNKSLRGMARHLELDPASVSRTLSGKRNLQMSEANGIAAFLGIPVEDVLSHAGISFSADFKEPMQITEIVYQDGAVQKNPNPTPVPEHISKQISKLPALPKNICAAIVKAPEGMLSLWDDAVLIYQPNSDPELAKGSLSVVVTHDNRTIIANVRALRKTQEAQLKTANGDLIETRITAASPILLVIP